MAVHSSPLDHVRVAAPCPARWEEMTGNDRTRFCSQCSLHVHNLSAMRRDEAEALIAEAEGRLCVRFYRRGDGTIITQDCPVGVQAARQRTSRRIRNTVAGTAALLAGAIGLGGSRLWGASGTVADNMATVRPLSPVESSGQITMTEEQGEVAVVMGDSLLPVALGEMTPPEQDTLEERRPFTVRTGRFTEEPTSIQPATTPDSTAMTGQTVITTDDSTHEQQMNIPDVAPRSDIR